MSEGVRLYAGTQHGLIVWRSKNGGWEEVSRGFEDGIIDLIHGCHDHPERVYVGVTHNGLYRSEDGGRTWKKILDGDIRSVAVDPTSDDVIYAGVEPVALYRSEDRGDNWKELASLKNVRKRRARTGGFRSRRIRDTCATFSSIRTIREPFISASSTAASCAASTAAKIGKT